MVVMFIWNSVVPELSLTFLLSVFILLLCAVKGIQVIMENLSLPPGPWGYPIVGSYYQSKNNTAPHLYYKGLVHKYGSLISTKIGSQVTVVLAEYKLIRDCFRKEEFTGRPTTELTGILGGYGVINTAGRLWKEQRRFVHEGLRHFGMSYFGSKKEKMEGRIMREVEEFLSVLETQQGAPVDLNPIFAVSISNVICDILMSVRFSHNDTRFKRFMHLIEEGFRLFGSMEATVLMPFLQYFPWSKTQETKRKIAQNREEMAEFFQETIEEHRKTFDANNIRDLLDTYLHEIQQANEAGTGEHLFEGKDHDRQMQQILGDLFSAGMETIKSSLLWAIVFMLHHPEAMKAVQEELDQVVGRQRLAKLEDLPFLPITESTIFEVLRRSSTVPMGTTHATTRDVKLNGFHIPENVQVVPLLHAVHMDPNLWEEPEQFDPTRFINSEGKVFKPEYFLPFGVGRRICLGEMLAKMEIFLFFTSFLHRFDIFVPEGENAPGLIGNVGVTLSPCSFKVILKRRTQECATTSIRPAGSH